MGGGKAVTVHEEQTRSLSLSLKRRESSMYLLCIGLFAV
jgi:hypothetical protein